ncbi:MAG: precorrin-2 dehydrogenase/sirohydrochlorin ferrochelatase family protein [Planctomycetota bacterium]|jgi:precorrin-2 dehydrogenase/sirohydrochlorin ferrochelatase
MARYPIYLDLAGKRVVVIGAGPVAARKANALQKAGARVIIVAKTVDSAFEKSCNLPHVEVVISAYSKDYLAEAVLAIAATNDLDLNRRIYKDCQELEVLCNVVDQPDLCDFFVPAVVKRGPLQIAISTDGNCPAYAGHVRKKLEGQFTEDHGRFVVELEAIRKHIIEEVADSAERKTILGRLAGDKSFDYFLANGPAEWQSYAQQIIAQSQ